MGNGEIQKIGMAIALILGLLLSGCVKSEKVAERRLLGVSGPEKGSPSILNGVEVAETTATQMSTMLIEFSDAGGGKHRCSGTLVDKRVVLTASHCLVNDQGVAHSNILVNFFQTQVDDKTRAQSPEKLISGINFVVHPMYTYGDNATGIKRDLRFDLGLLLLKQDAPLGFVPAKIPLTYESWQGKDLFVSGYGRTQTEADKGPVKLRQAGVQLATQSEIQDLQSQGMVDSFDGVNVKETPRMLILQQDPNDSGICLGDSGGPLFDMNDDRIEVVGVNSAVGPSTVRECFSWGSIVSVTYHRMFLADAYQKLIRKSLGLTDQVALPPDALQVLAWRETAALETDSDNIELSRTPMSANVALTVAEQQVEFISARLVASNDQSNKAYSNQNMEIQFSADPNFNCGSSVFSSLAPPSLVFLYLEPGARWATGRTIFFDKQSGQAIKDRVQGFVLSVAPGQVSMNIKSETRSTVTVQMPLLDCTQN